MRRRSRRIPFYLLLALIAVYLLFPVYWVLRTSISPDAEVYATPVQYIPANPTLQNYMAVLQDSTFLRAIANSVLVSGSVTILSLAVGAGAAYALARFKFRGRSFMLYLILSMTVFPQIAVLGALYQMVHVLHLYNTLTALILTYLIFTLPFTVWTLTTFFRSVPRELEEAAYVDGANPFQTFYRIMVPLAAPGMVTAGILALIAAWNEFLYALSFEFTPDHYTVALLITESSTSTPIPWGPIMAAVVVVEVPLLLVVLLFQRRIVTGLTAGAVKG